jgi:hypothetical protein
MDLIELHSFAVGLSLRAGAYLRSQAVERCRGGAPALTGELKQNEADIVTKARNGASVAIKISDWINGNEFRPMNTSNL